MRRQEHREAVSRLLEQVEALGQVRRNLYLPDLATGKPRRLGLVVEMVGKGGHEIRILIDARYRKREVDVPYVEAVCELARAVGVGQAVIVAANDYSFEAMRYAARCSIELRILDPDMALHLVVPEKWQVCPACEQDCVVVEPVAMVVHRGKESVLRAGRCRHCGLGRYWCPDCGGEGYLKSGRSHTCDCGHRWACRKTSMLLRTCGSREFRDIIVQLPATTPETRRSQG